jgi:hypothetical protein
MNWNWLTGSGDRRLPNALPFSGLGAAKPALRFYADTSAATRSDLQRHVSRLVTCYIVIHEARNIDTQAR